MFDWDEPKRRQVIKDHGVDFERITDIFNDPFASYFDDHEHSDDSETRSGIIGKTAEYGLVILIYKLLENDKVRFITARRAEKWMVKDYERQRKRR